jgi:ABC-type transport system involved in cytochrome c biogenesis permease subunit
MLKTIICLFLALFMTVTAHAQTNFPMEKFGELPILHEGRLKPLDSFTRYEILRFAKRENPNDADYLTWLATALFDPVQSVTEKIFFIDDAVTRHRLGLEERRKPFYSYAELSEGLDKTSAEVMDIIRNTETQPNKDQQELLEVHENALQYKQILRSFSSILPLNITLTDEWRNKAGLAKDAPVTFTSLQKINPDIEENIKRIIKRKGDDPAKYTLKEQELVALGLQIKTLSDASGNNNLFRVIPTLNDELASPWEIINDGKGSPTAATHLKIWSDLATAWQNKDAQSWVTAIDKIDNQFFYDPPLNYDGGRLWLEVIYNQLAPFEISLLIFSLSFVLSCIYFVNRSPLIYRCATITLYSALFIQLLGLVFRIYLMERPPVGTLYESILFVALIAPLVSLFVERHLKNGIGILSGAVAGTMLGLLALSMAGEGDNMKVLGAVLNTRFWLTTHVLCITIGYGWCLLTSVLAHLVLLQKAFGSINSTNEGKLIKIITTHGLFSLLFTIIGTILGGIWADQSWGRFWGWDPKENGALLIVLWLIWFIHGKITGHISQLVWLGGLAFLSVIVAVAWIGVNLLGVGLHSYGFIDGVFWGLASFAIFELILIGGLMMIVSNNRKKYYAT